MIHNVTNVGEEYIKKKKSRKSKLIDLYRTDCY